MKKDQLPQDNGALGKLTGELCYVQNEDGSYTQAQSNGWDVKTAALDITWEKINEEARAAFDAFKAGNQSPIPFYLKKHVMDMETIRAYTGFWGWQIKRHFKPGPFSKLSPKSLQKYADAFGVTVEQLKKGEMND